MRRAAVSAAFGLALLSAGASAQPDPWAARVRAYSDVPLGSLQGADCVTIAAPKSVVWRLLVSPETVSTWLLEGIPGIVPRGASYAKGLTASKGDVLSMSVTTSEGPRRIELSVIALQPGEVLSFLLKSDDADLIGAKVERLTLSFFVEGRPDKTTDLTWVSHFDADSPFSALLSPTQTRTRRARRLSSLHVFKAMAEEAARLPYPPLHDLPDEPQPTSAPKRRK
jgi:uncharacterized protein YndB with AHSA1/START domain